MKHERSWKTINSQRFEQDILPHFFDHSNISSFIRQANGWGFRRITNGPDRDSYYNEYFLRGLPYLIKNMRRPRVAKKVQIDSEHEPDLALISDLHPLSETALTPDVIAILNCILKNGPKARMPVHPDALPDFNSMKGQTHLSGEVAISSVPNPPPVGFAEREPEEPTTCSQSSSIRSYVSPRLKECPEQSSVDADLVRNLLSLKTNQTRKTSTSTAESEPPPRDLNSDPLHQHRKTQEDMLARWEHNQLRHYANMALFQQQQQQHHQQNSVQRMLLQIMQSCQSQAMAERELMAQLLATYNNPPDAGVVGRIFGASRFHLMPHEKPSVLGTPTVPPQMIVNEQISRDHSRSIFEALKKQAAARSAISSDICVPDRVDNSSIEKRSTTDLLQSILTPSMNNSQSPPNHHLSISPPEASENYAQSLLDAFKRQTASRSAIVDGSLEDYVRYFENKSTSDSVRNGFTPTSSSLQTPPRQTLNVLNRGVMGAYSSSVNDSMMRKESPPQSTTNGDRPADPSTR